MDFSDKFHEISDEIKSDFMNVTNMELVLSDCFINMVCELCLRSLQLAVSFKTVLIENQEKFVRDFEYTSPKFDEDDFFQDSPRKTLNF